MNETQSTFVSLTPLPLDRDSRAIKIAASFAGFGYRSVVIENRQSMFAGPRLSVERITLGCLKPAVQATGTASPFPHAPSEDLPTRLKQALRPLAPRWLRERVHFLVFFFAYYLLRPLQGAFQVPSARLYYLHEYRLFPLVWLLRKLRPAALIYDAHDCYMSVEADADMSPFLRRRFHPLLGRMERWCISHADAVVTVSDGVADLIEDRYGTRPIVLRNLHDPRLDENPAISLRDNVGVDADDFLIVVVGNRKPCQAIDETIEILAALPARVHLAFVGRFYEDTIARARELGVADRVHVVGPIKPWEIVPFIESADAAAILYFPYTDNSRHMLPNGFLQSLSARLPLLYPRLPEFLRLLGDTPVGREIDPRDPASVRTAIQGMLDSPDTLGEYRANLENLANEVSWACEENRLRELVDRVLKTQ